MDWRKEYSVGIPEIDEEHKGLLSCVTEIERALESGNKGAMLHSAIGQLAHLTKAHFAVEETLMRIEGYQNTDGHIEGHGIFSKALGTIEKKSLQDGLSIEDLDFMRTWLEMHFALDDKMYATFVVRKDRKA